MGGNLSRPSIFFYQKLVQTDNYAGDGLVTKLEASSIWPQR